MQLILIVGIVGIFFMLKSIEAKLDRHQEQFKAFCTDIDARIDALELILIQKSSFTKKVPLTLLPQTPK